MLVVLGAAAVLAVPRSVAGEIENLWPEGRIPDFRSGQVALPGDRVDDADFRAGQRGMPYLEWCDAPAADRKTDVCMILISGGGYDSWCDVGLVDEWADKLGALGVRCVKLVYRTPRPEGLPIHQSAWEDGQRGVRMVRSEAASRGFDPEKIGVMSMSAGSHLALLLATSSLTPAYDPVDELDRVPCHINWALPNAIGFALTDGIGCPNMTGGDGDGVTLDGIFKFDEKTCPMCMTHGGKDPYSPIASTFVYRRLRSMKVPAELHLYPDRGHGAYGFDRQLEFMRQMGYLKTPDQPVELLTRYPDNAARSRCEKADLWPEGAMPDAQAHQTKPYLEWHFPEVRTSDAIQIVYSGGGYRDSVPDGFEVAPIRRYLNAQGLTVVTVNYRHPRPVGLPKHQSAWEDLQRAIRIVRRDAPRYGLDPARIGIMGSSAGGHLTLLGVTSSTRPAYAPVDETDAIPCNVQWGVAIYPAYALTDGVDCGNTTGGNDDGAVPVPEFAFDDAVCPVLFIHGDADVYAAMNSVKCWERLRRMGVQSELHTLALRPHCFQRMALEGTGSYTWMDRVRDFLFERGVGSGTGRR